MFEQLLAWLSKDGPFEEFFLLLLFIVIGLFVLILLKTTSINIKGVRLESKKTTGEKTEKESASDPPAQQQNNKHYIASSAIGSNISVTAYQDFIIINLIIQNHSNRVRDEIRQYCMVNGIDKKSKDEYFSYVEEKKGIYVNELKEMINREYMSYDIISLDELYSIIADLKDTIINKLDKLYIKIRDISVADHAKIEEEKENIYRIIVERFTDWRTDNYDCDEKCTKRLNEIIDSYKKEYEKILLDERINILVKQIHRIDAVCKELTDLILDNVIEKINEKVKSKDAT